MLTDALSVELWITSLCVLLNGSDPCPGPLLCIEIAAWRYEGRPRA